MKFSWVTLPVTSKGDRVFWTGAHLLKIQPGAQHDLFPARACLLLQPDIICNIPALFCRSRSQSLPSLHRVILHSEKELPTFPCWTLKDFSRHNPQIYSSVSRLRCCYSQSAAFPLMTFWGYILCVTIHNIAEGHWTTSSPGYYSHSWLHTRSQTMDYCTSNLLVQLIFF